MTDHHTHGHLNSIDHALRFYTRKLCTLIFAFFATLTTSAMAIGAPKPLADLNVVSSIKPIQLITTAIVGNLGESKILLPPSANPHNYQLRPSQRTLINNADLFVWVGPELELFLVKVLNTSSVNQLSLTESLQLSSGQHETLEMKHNENHGHDEHNHSTTDQNGSFDPHIWLNPAFTEQIAKAIYQQLSIQRPEIEPQLSTNLNQFINQLHATEDEITTLFEPRKSIAIYTFHEAFTHFADHYGLVIAGTITRTPDARPGAKHLSELAGEIRKNKKICLVKEPNFKAPYIESITRGTEVIITMADPLATDINNSETGYFEFIRSIANSFYTCLR